MKVKYLGESDPCCLMHGKVYLCLGEEDGYYRVIDEEGTDEDDDIPGYLYEKELFEVVNGDGR